MELIDTYSDDARIISQIKAGKFYKYKVSELVCIMEFLKTKLKNKNMWTLNLLIAFTDKHDIEFKNLKEFNKNYTKRKKEIKGFTNLLKKYIKLKVNESSKRQGDFRKILSYGYYIEKIKLKDNIDKRELINELKTIQKKFFDINNANYLSFIFNNIELDYTEHTLKNIYYDIDNFK